MLSAQRGELPAKGTLTVGVALAPSIAVSSCPTVVELAPRLESDTRIHASAYSTTSDHRIGLFTPPQRSPCMLLPQRSPPFHERSEGANFETGTNDIWWIPCRGLGERPFRWRTLLQGEGGRGCCRGKRNSLSEVDIPHLCLRPPTDPKNFLVHAFLCAMKRCLIFRVYVAPQDTCLTVRRGVGQPSCKPELDVFPFLYDPS